MKGSVICLALAGCVLGPNPPPAPPRTTHLGLQLEQLELANGLRVVVVQDPSASELAVTMRYQVGSVDDPVGQEGIAHLVEHLMYQQVLGADTLFSHLENATTYFNGETTYDATTYLARANPEHLDELLSIEAVRLGLRCTSLNDSAFERERAVVINELRQSDGGAELRSAFARAVYPEGHPYRSSIGGTEASVGALTRAQACAFADAHYGPSNAVLVVSGKVTTSIVETALKKFMTHVAKHAVVAPVAVPAVGDARARVEIAAPIEHDAILVTWPLPADPLVRIRMRALAPELASVADSAIKGQIRFFELGDTRAPMIGFVGTPGEGESSQEVIEAISKGANEVGAMFSRSGFIEVGELTFDRMKQAAIYRLFSSLDDASDRDVRLATEVLAGRDPSAAIAATFKGLREMQRAEATALARTYFAFEHARIAKLVASGSHRGKAEQLATSVAIHDLGLHRDPPDPELALAPMTDPSAPPAVSMVVRILGNGMRVVLLPGSTVPTVEARLVFGTGTGDEPAEQRGVALLAAETLTWNDRYLNDLLLFAASGGSIDTEVELDHTSFIARGLDMHLDLLLTGMRQLVRNGVYSRNPAHIAAAIRVASKTDNDNGELTDAWRSALYGADHPYVTAGIVRHLSSYLTLESLAQFRQANFQPANATLVIAGHFDAALAQRWIDFLFADWSSSKLAARPSGPARPQPLSLATFTNQAKRTSQLELVLALPATKGTRAQQLIAAEMLSIVASEIRHQLGASYGVRAALATERLSNTYDLGGAVDVTRATDSFKLLADRLAELRADPNAAARTFVLARSRVVTHLRAMSGASALARKVELDISLGLPPLSDLETATAAAALTIDQETSALADLDLGHALIWLRGPEATVTEVFSSLGRTPTVIIHRPLAAIPRAVAGSSSSDDDEGQHITLDEVEPALSQQRASQPLAIGVEAGFASGSVSDTDVSGFSVAGQVGYRIDDTTTIGGYFGLGRVTGSYQSDVSMPPHEVTNVPLDLAGYARATAYDRLFGLVFMGLHVNFASDNGTAVRDSGIGAGLGVGIDLWTSTHDRLAAYAAVQGELLTDVGYVAATLGLGYHH